jgi:hypothetical protein
MTFLSQRDGRERHVEGVDRSWWGPGSVEVATSANGSTGGAQDHENDADDGEDDSQRLEDRNLGDQADHEQDESENDHDVLLTLDTGVEVSVQPPGVAPERVRLET